MNTPGNPQDNTPTDQPGYIPPTGQPGYSQQDNPQGYGPRGASDDQTWAMACTSWPWSRASSRH